MFYLGSHTSSHIKIFKNYSSAYPYRINAQPSDILMWKKLCWEMWNSVAAIMLTEIFYEILYCCFSLCRLKLQSKTFRSVNHGHGKDIPKVSSHSCEFWWLKISFFLKLNHFFEDSHTPSQWSDKVIIHAEWK